MPKPPLRQRPLVVCNAADAGTVPIVDPVQPTGAELAARPVARVVPMTRPEEREAAVMARLRGTRRLLVRQEDFGRAIDDAGWSVLLDAESPFPGADDEDDAARER